MKFEGTHSKNSASEVAVGATTKDTIESSSFIWLLKGNNGRMVLVDAGYTDTAMINQDFPTINYIRPDSVLKNVNVKTEGITDIIITHPHLDHIGGIDLFPNALRGLYHPKAKSQIMILQQGNFISFIFSLVMPQPRPFVICKIIRILRKN